MSVEAIPALGDLIALEPSFDLPMRPSGRIARIFVSKPVGPPPAGGFPVVYMTDANLLFVTMAQQAMLRTLSGEISDSIIVGIGYPVQTPAAALAERMIEFAPSSSTARDRGPADAGMQVFGDFVIHHLIPEIEARYPIDPTRRSLFGYSLGGLFALHLLAREGELFASVVAASPSIWYDEDNLLQALSNMKGDLKTRLLLTVGSLEESAEHVAAPPGMTADQALGVMEKAKMIERARSFASRITQRAATEEQIVLTEFEGETHASTPAAAISAALTFMLNSWGR